LILSDRDIKRELAQGHLCIEPNPIRINKAHLIQPASIDLQVASDFRILDPDASGVIDPKRKHDYTRPQHCTDAKFTIPADRLVLVSTVQKVVIPPYLVGVVDGKSSLARLGLKVHYTAGYIDPGFRGYITLELESKYPFVIHVGMDICQIRFHALQSECERSYGESGRYQDQEGATPSRYYQGRIAE
jgi:dCTP deaminase